MINQNSYVTLEKAIATSQELLTQYAFSDELLGDLTTAFGTEYNREVAEELVGQWQTGEFDSFPEIEIRSSTEINGANGAYSADTNKIYISEEYLLANTNNLKAISNLVIEEYGHYVDASINSVDAAGDEGAIFSGLVTGESFSEGELQQLQLENDKAVITLDGEEIAIEQQLIEAQTGLPITLPENFALREDLTNVLVGDFNNDGIDDFLRQEKGNGSGDGVNTADIFIADGNRDFSNISLPENLNIDGDLNNLHIGDFNGDGVDDILRQQKGSTDDDNPDTGRIYLNNGSGNFSVTRRISLPESLLIEGDLNNLHIGDFNGDGVDDILRQQKGSTDDDNEDTGRIYLNDGSGNFSVTRQISLFENFNLKGDLTDLYVGDFNGDGKDDFVRVAKNNVSDRIFFAEGEGNDITFNRQALKFSDGSDSNLNTQTTRSIGVADVNGDGKDDIFRHRFRNNSDARDSNTYDTAVCI